jgi:hypothetical protein
MSIWSSGWATAPSTGALGGVRRHVHRVEGAAGGWRLTVGGRRLQTRAHAARTQRTFDFDGWYRCARDQEKWKAFLKAPRTSPGSQFLLVVRGDGLPRVPPPGCAGRLVRVIQPSPGCRPAWAAACGAPWHPAGPLTAPPAVDRPPRRPPDGPPDPPVLQGLWQYNTEATLMRVKFLASGQRGGPSHTVLVTDIPGMEHGTIKWLIRGVREDPEVVRSLGAGRWCEGSISYLCGAFVWGLGVGPWCGALVWGLGVGPWCGALVWGLGVVGGLWGSQPWWSAAKAGVATREENAIRCLKATNLDRGRPTARPPTALTAAGRRHAVRHAARPREEAGARLA